MARDPYEVLGVARDATLREASAAYRRMAELYHPDRLRQYRTEVQDEGAQRLREANQAIRVLRTRLRGPLVAPGHDGNGSHDGDERKASRSTPVASAGDGHVPAAPSDAATAAARLYYVDLQAVDAPEFHVRWAGPHAAATLTALKQGHRLDGGPIREIEWGTYAALLEGDATLRLLVGVLPEDAAWHDAPVDVVAIEDDDHALPARLTDGEPVVTLETLVSMLDDDTWYEVLADAY